jgi:vanillate O-demethylase ferredoxin subunit
MLNLRIKSAVWEAPKIISYELRPTNNSELPPFTAGAHIDIKLPSGMVRSYSLLNPQSERHRYVIAVQRDRESRGGSKWIHQNFRPGEILSVNEPRNNFKLDETAEKSVFIAGGIGITPMLSMIERLGAIGRDWELIFCARTRSSAPFLGLLANNPRVRLNFDREPGADMLDIGAVVEASSPDSHLYCCGPITMLDAFEQATKDRARETVHVEYFTAKEPPATEGGFTVVLAKSGKEVVIPPGKTILAALRDEGFDLAHSCTEGVCGTCETKVLEGVPDHRDRILTEAERASNKTMMICCSGSKVDRLVLDL